MQALLVFLLLLFAAPLHAEDVFVIDNIYADKAADTATIARNLAIADAQRQGLTLVINRLTDPNMRRALPKLTDQGVAAMVKSFEVTDERISGNRYQARLTVFYDEGAVKDFLSQNKVDVLTIKSPPILVFPILTSGTEPVLWEPENPWRKAWRQALNAPSEINLIAPLGDAEDVHNVTAADLKAGKFDALLGFANKYGAQEVLIAEAFFVNNGKLLVTRLQPVGNSPTLAKLADFKQELDAGGDGFWEQAVASIQQKILEQWSGQTQPLGEVTGKHITVIVALSEGLDWLAMKSKLESVPMIKSMDMQELSVKRAVIDLEYTGPLSKFQEALDKQKLDLLQEGDSFVLRKVAE